MIKAIETSFDFDEIVDFNLLTEEEGFTIVHCNYVSKPIYINGGWINIRPTTYLVNKLTSERLELLHVINVPVSPAKHYFRKEGELLNFTLLFKKVPEHWTQFDLIEKTGDGSGFHKYGIMRNGVGVYRVSLV